jgi:hypothetical protein
MSCHDPRAMVIATIAVIAAVFGGAAAAQGQDEQTPPPGRAAEVERAQLEKSANLQAYEPNRAEHMMAELEKKFLGGHIIGFHPFFESAYAGGGFTLGAGYIHYVSSYNQIDLRGSYTLAGYKRVEAAFTAPRLFDRRGVLTILGGWREATAVGFYGIGSANTSKDDRANYSFDQPYGAAALDLWPARKLLVLHGGVEVSKWNVGAGNGPAPPVDEVYTPDTLAGLGAHTRYLHSDALVGIDSRPSPGYARSGGFYGISFHDFRDADGLYGFRRTDYEVIQHVPILRETWVLSLHGRAQLANAAAHQTVPFFMLPSLGGGSSLRGFSSWRFRDLNSLLLQADWRVIASRFMDLALFYDAGRVSARRSDLATGPLKSDYGVGFRLHSAAATPLRIEIAHGNEGLEFVFSAKAAF